MWRFCPPVHDAPLYHVETPDTFSVFNHGPLFGFRPPLLCFPVPPLFGIAHFLQAPLLFSYHGISSFPLLIYGWWVFLVLEIFLYLPIAELPLLFGRSLALFIVSKASCSCFILLISPEEFWVLCFYVLIVCYGFPLSRDVCHPIMYTAIWRMLQFLRLCFLPELYPLNVSLVETIYSFPTCCHPSSVRLNLFSIHIVYLLPYSPCSPFSFLCLCPTNPRVPLIHCATPLLACRFHDDFMTSSPGQSFFLVEDADIRTRQHKYC